MSFLTKFLITWVLGMLVWSSLALLASIPVALLWNWLVPEIFKLPEIGFLQAFGLLLLLGLLTRTNAKVSVES